MTQTPTPQDAGLIERARAEAVADAKTRTEVTRMLYGSDYGPVSPKDLTLWQLADRLEALSQPSPALAEPCRECDAVSSAIGGPEFMDPPDGGDVPLSEQVRRMREALNAARALTEPGYRLVPVEPTEEMATAFIEAEDASIKIDPLGAFEDGYAAMLAASPASRGEG